MPRKRTHAPASLAGKRMADHRPGQRTCLKCGRPFPSLGPGHRVCNGCQRKQEAPTAAERHGGGVGG